MTHISTKTPVSIPSHSLVVLTGLPGCGKSTFCTEHFPADSVLSSDQLRAQILGTHEVLRADGVKEQLFFQQASTTVFKIIEEMVKCRLAERKLTVIDATNLTETDRNYYAKLANDFGAPFFLVMFDDLSFEEIQHRNNRRAQRVPYMSYVHMVKDLMLKKLEGVKGGAELPENFMDQMPPMRELLTAREHSYKVWPVSLHTFEVTVPSIPSLKMDVVGDVHGLLHEFISLCQKAGWDTENWTHPDPERVICLLGDVVDRGPYSIELLQLCLKLWHKKKLVMVKGNHDHKLVRTYDEVKAGTFKEVRSWAGAETAAELFKLDADEQARLVSFIRNLPTMLVCEEEKIAFVHANVEWFDPNITLGSHAIFGTNIVRDVDTDAVYQNNYDQGINKYTVIRGHIPPTSIQPNIFSLEMHAFQKGQLKLLALDKFVALRKDPTIGPIKAFEQSVTTHDCDFDFEAHKAQRFALQMKLNELMKSKHVVRQGNKDNTLFVYKYSSSVFWNAAWGHSDMILETRGLVLDFSGAIVSRPFTKCFNYKEQGAGQDLAENTPVVEVEKLNGFLGVVSKHPFKKGELLVHTQGSIEGPFSEYVKEYVNRPKTKGLISRFLAKNKGTLMFEVIHPDDPHIVEYDKSMMGLHLIGYRELSLDAKVWTEEQLDALGKELDLPRPKWRRTTLKTVFADNLVDEGEGCMVRADTPDQEYLFKLKSPTYLTTKFLGRASVAKINHMYANPTEFKRTIDEEFYFLVDAITSSMTKEQYQAMSDTDRVVWIRELTQKFLKPSS